MNRLLFLLLLGTLPLRGQDIPRRGTFSLLGGYGFSQTLINPQVTVLNGPYQLQAETVKNVECYDDAGRLVDCNGQQRQLNLGIHYRLADKSRQGGWMLLANVSHQQQVYTLNYPANRRFSIPVNCTPSIHRHSAQWLPPVPARSQSGSLFDIGRQRYNYRDVQQRT